MSKNGNRKRNRRKNNKEDQRGKNDMSQDELYDEFLSMFGESVDPIEIFNVLKKNEWKPEPSVDELMQKSQQYDAKKASPKFDASLYEEDLNYQAIASKPHQSSQNLNYYNYSPYSPKTEKSNVKQFNEFHDVKVVYKGDNSEDEADADIIIEEEDVCSEQGLKVLRESTVPFQTNVLMNVITSHIPSSSPNHVKNNPKTLNSDFERLNIDNSAFQKNVSSQRYAPSAPTLNMTVTNSASQLETTSIQLIYQECLEIIDTVDRVCSLVLNSIKVMVLLRGCPGSGKSFMAEKIVMNVNKIRPHMNLKLKDHVFSTDDYFMTPKHGYRFDARMLPEAHDWNRKRAQKALSKNLNPVIIDNTNTQIWEMAPYVQLGVQFGYIVEILEPETKWKFNEYELFRRNIHGVPRANIRNMLERYEHGITKDNILQMLNYHYDPSKKPPQTIAVNIMSVSKNTPTANTAPPKVNGWPANFLQPSRDLATSSFQSDEQNVYNNQNDNVLSNDSSTKENKFSNLTASCRSFFEKSLLTLAADGSLISNYEANSAKVVREQTNRSRAASRNALLSSMMKDSNMPDVVAKTPSIPQGWLSFNNQVTPKPLIGDEVRNIVEKNANIIDLGNRENFEVRNVSHTKQDELPEAAGMISKVDITQQAQSLQSNSLSLINACSSKTLDSNLSENTAIKDSQSLENNNLSEKMHPNVAQLEYPKIETVNLNEKVSVTFENKCLMDEENPDCLDSENLMPCLVVNKLTSNIQTNGVVTNNYVSHSNDSTDSVHESKLSPPEEESVGKTSIPVHEETFEKSSQSSEVVGSTNENKEDTGNDVSKEVNQEMHSSPNKQLLNNFEDLCLANDVKNTDTSNQELSSAVTEMNEACGTVPNTIIENEHCNPVSNSEVGNNIDIEDNKFASTKQENQQLAESVSNEVKTPNIDFKNFRFKPSKLDSKNEEAKPPNTDFKEFKFTKLDNKTSNNKDLFFSELKDDPVHDYFNDAEISALLESLQELDFEFVSEEEAKRFEEAIKNEAATAEGIETAATSNNGSDEPASEVIISNSDSTNVCQKSDSLKQSNTVETVENSDLSDQLNSMSPMMDSKELKVESPLSPSDESDGLNTSSPLNLLSDSYVSVPEDDNNSDSVYFDVDPETSESINIDRRDLNDDDQSKSNNDEVSNKNEVSNEVVNSVQIDTDKSVGNVSQTTVVDEGDDENENNGGESSKIDEELILKSMEKEEVVEELKKVEEMSSIQTPVTVEEAPLKTSVTVGETPSPTSVPVEETSSQTSATVEKTPSPTSSTVEETPSPTSATVGETPSPTSVPVEETSSQTSATVEKTPSPTSATVEENPSPTVEETPAGIAEETNDEIDSKKLSNFKEEKEVVTESSDSQSEVAEEPAAQKESSISIDGVKALLKGGVPVKTFDVMSWLKNSFIRESSQESSGIQTLLSDSAENVMKNVEQIVVDEGGNLNSQFSNPISAISTEHVEQNEFTSKPSREIERTVPAQQNYSIVGSSHTVESRKRNRFLNWDSVDEPEKSWAENMKNTLGASDGMKDRNSPKCQREENLQPVDERVDMNKSAAAKVIDILSNNGKCVEQKRTEEEFFGQKLQELAKLFPETQSIYMEEILRQCKGDVNWAAGLLLEGGCEVSAEAYCSTNNAARGLVEIGKKATDDDLNQAGCSKSSSKKQKKEKKNANSNMSEARVELKKMMEQNFVLSKNSYSDHLLKLLKFRRGEVDPEHETGMIDGCDPELFLDGYHGEQLEGEYGYPTGGEQFEHFEGTELSNQEPQTAEATAEDEEMLEFVFNKDVITTLSYNFGSSGFPLDMADVSCPVKLPMRLARELHSYWMDSVEEYLSQENMRMQMMIKEDEELAKRLQQEEASAVNPNLQEVIDYETALMLHEANLKKEREAQGTDTTVAAKLSLSILAEKYPREKEEFLSQLLSSNNNSLHNTLELLKITREQQHTQEQQTAENVKHEFDNCHESSIFEESETLQSSYERSRDEAKMHFIKRNEYFQKAQQEYTSGSKAAASFFSQLANMHMKKMEEANCKAATLLLCTSRSTQNTLDLHFYQAREAVQVLNLFIDASMTRLEESRKPKMKIFIITGRGLHSVNGKSVIKPIVMRRLQQRNIRFHEDETNPGAIICTLTRHS